MFNKMLKGPYWGYTVVLSVYSPPPPPRVLPALCLIFRLFVHPLPQPLFLTRNKVKLDNFYSDSA